MIQTRNVVGVIGKAGSGKDTFADMFTDELISMGILSSLYSFAEPLKRGCAELFGIDLQDFYDRDKKEVIIERWGKSPRDLLIMVGTDLLRDQFDDDIWVIRAKQYYQKYGKGIVVVFPDIRFDNEVSFVKDCNGYTFEILRDVKSRDVVEIEHKSEHGVSSSSDYVIYNDGTLSDLRLQAEKYAHLLYGKE